jgi:CRISPR-associated endonuclease Cas1
MGDTAGETQRDLIPISLVAHEAFCPRRAWLEAVGETTDTHQVAIGIEAHAPADDPSGSRSRRYRAVDVISHDLGVVGRCDTVELDENAAMTVIEHKATPVRRRPEVTEPMRVQVALLAGALADMGYPVKGQAIYFTNHHTRVEVCLFDEDMTLARETVAATARTLTAEEAPPVLEDDRRCSRCSHITVCLPDERPLAPVTRRIVVADPDTQVLHLSTAGSLLRRHGDAPLEVAQLRQLQRDALEAPSLADLFGIEGNAAARYFECFLTMFRPNVVAAEQLTFFVRTRRPARDPVNAALNLCYGLLTADALRAVVACGLDPHAGFLHSSGRNKPALALDLVEEFRAPVADSVVINAFNNGEIRARDFSTVLGSMRVGERGRKVLIAGYERRVTGTFRHPVFGYDVTWRRAMEIQARLVLGVIDGTQPRYQGIKIQ